jgi:pimeloyl-ACP methyl ester carboxylesterase
MIEQFEGAPWLDTSQPTAVEPIAEKLSAIAKPVLLINGEHDLEDFKDIAQRIASSLPNARSAVIPNAGGFPLWEYPDAVNACVRRFLDELS